MNLVPLPGQRIAIRHGDALLAVPTLHPSTPRTVRVQVYELVLRRLFCEALELAEYVHDELEGRSRSLARTQALMGPGKNSWEMGGEIAA